MFHRLRVLFLVLAVILGTTSVKAQTATQSKDGVWTQLPTSEVEAEGFKPTSNIAGLFSAFTLNQNRIGDILNAAPQEFTEQARNKSVVVSIPFPSGTFQQFRIEKSPIITKPLESAGFETLTYSGIGIDDPTATIRFETAFDGFHAIVRSGAGVFYIDPMSNEAQINRRPYLSYFSEVRPSPPKRIRCAVSEGRALEDRRRGAAKRAAAGPAPAAPQAFSAAPSVLRIYRLAVAANSYYVEAVYDKNLSASRFDQAAHAITLTIDRVNEIYGAEHGVRLDLVDDEAKIIYTDPTNDPYRTVNADASAALDANQKNLDDIIGSANYDIGHLFTTATSGLATVGYVCDKDYKAHGVTGIAQPVGDAFDVDYVSHEIGHQFGANHTFNSQSSGCSGNRFRYTAFEPGSGSTIMAYAGLCDPTSLQDHSDDYFHIASLDEIKAYITDTTPGAGGSCPVLKPLPFVVPAVLSLPTYTIPKGTPFVLSASISRSANTFNWEEYDLGDPAPPDDENGPAPTVRPLFRSRKPGPGAIRYFPNFPNLMGVQGSSTSGEALPMLDQLMRFHLTERNNHGGFTYSETSVKVQGGAGPFKVFPTSGGKTWPRGSVHRLTWDVAHTDAAPVSCAHVLIQLAVDGDESRVRTLARDVTNSGAYNLTIPDDAPITSRARIIVRGSR